MSLAVTEHALRTPRHTTRHLACGPADGTALVFVHGWPELAISWRHQLPCFGALGFRAVAPDMRGYGGSTVHPRLEDYAMREVVADLVELIDHLGRERVVLVGHDWGAVAVWSFAQHHADRLHGIANLCVPYLPLGFGLESLVPLVDRRLYPVDAHPVGQWDYHLHYEESFDAARAAFEADTRRTVKALFRRGRPEHVGRPSRLASVRRDGGWFGPAGVAPELPLDTAVLDEADLDRYASALQRNGFSGPNAWYRNAEANAAFARAAAEGGRLSLPVLFLHARFDAVCETLDSRLAEPMRANCDDLAEAVVPTGHWMAQERPELVNAALSRWLATRLPSLWPAGTEPMVS